VPGPPKTPTVIRKARGNRGHENLNHIEPHPAATTADPPPELTGDARALWQRLAPELVRIGTLTSIDREELAVGCRLRAVGLRALTHSEQEGVRLPSGALNALKEASRILGRFGVGASDRTKIHVQPPKPASKWQSLAS
jgi:phage terminase small subunit